MIEDGIQKLRIFLQKYNAFTVAHAQEKVQQNSSSFQNLFDWFANYTYNFKKLNRTHAYDFNLFSILNIGFYETRTHTPILYHLLNPRSAHGQGLFFYNLFLQELKLPLDRKEVFSETTEEKLEVVQEMYTGNGYADIFIRDKEFAIIIENKIFARDQLTQLERYYEHLEALQLKKENFLLLYLTLNGRMPQPDSLDPEVCTKMLNDGTLRCISYKEHISLFLKSAIRECSSKKVKYTLKQYRKTVKQISQ